MAFYARSEEARQSHAAQNFALVIFFPCFFMLFLSIFYLWRSLMVNYEFIISYLFSYPAYQLPVTCAWILQRALALEDALSKGLPIQTEIASLQSYLEGTDKDSVLDLVLASLPDETRNNGTDTQLQLKLKASCVLVCCWRLGLLVLYIIANLP